MKRNLLGCCATAAATGFWFLLCMPAAAQNAATSATPRTADGHSDLSGFYANHGAPGEAIFVTDEKGAVAKAGGSVLPGKPTASEAEKTSRAQARFEDALASLPYKAEFAAKAKGIVDSQTGDASPLDPGLKCQPLGVPRVMAGPFRIVQQPGWIAILYESITGDAFRIIPTDGRPHRTDLDPAFLGDSVGHWEGDTLVVDVTGLNDQTWLGTGGLIHSDQEHVTERFSRKGDVLTYEATVEDPVMFTKPWVIQPRHFTINNYPEDQMLESICVDNDSGHIAAAAEEKRN